MDTIGRLRSSWTGRSSGTSARPRSATHPPASNWPVWAWVRDVSTCCVALPAVGEGWSDPFHRLHIRTFIEFATARWRNGCPIGKGPRHVDRLLGAPLVPAAPVVANPTVAVPPNRHHQ